MRKPIRKNKDSIDKTKGMVVFPSSQSTLATTWVDTVDKIVTEGTGTADVNRLSEIKSKLENALVVVNNRLTEELDRADRRNLLAAKLDARKWLIEHGPGHIARVKWMGLAQTTAYMLVTCVTYDPTASSFLISGITFSVHIRNNGKGGIICSGIRTPSPIMASSLCIKNAEHRHYVISGAVQSVEFGFDYENGVTEDALVNGVSDELTRLGETCNQFKQMRKKCQIQTSRRTKGAPPKKRFGKKERSSSK